MTLGLRIGSYGLLVHLKCFDVASSPSIFPLLYFVITTHIITFTQISISVQRTVVSWEPFLLIRLPTIPLPLALEDTPEVPRVQFGREGQFSELGGGAHNDFVKISTCQVIFALQVAN